MGCGLWSRGNSADSGLETRVAYPAHDGQALARLHEGQAVVGRDHDGLPTLRAAVERGHGVARVRPKEHAAYRAVEARRLAHSDHQGRTVSLTHCNVLHRRLSYSLQPGERAARVTQNESARRGGGEHGDHDGRVVPAPLAPLFSRQAAKLMAAGAEKAETDGTLLAQHGQQGRRPQGRFPRTQLRGAFRCTITLANARRRSVLFWDATLRRSGLVVANGHSLLYTGCPA